MDVTGTEVRNAIETLYAAGYTIWDPNQRFVAGRPLTWGERLQQLTSEAVRMAYLIDPFGAAPVTRAACDAADLAHGNKGREVVRRLREEAAAEFNNQREPRHASA